MSPKEAGQLLAVAAGFDRRQVTEVTATAWALALAGYEYPACERAIIEHHRDPSTRGQYLSIGHVLDRVEEWHRAKSTDVEADVRSAKARGLIHATHPRREPLPKDVADRLQAARERDRDELLRHSPPELTR